MEPTVIDTEDFRDHISTVDRKGKRLWIYPKRPKGRFTNYRTIFDAFLLVLMFSGPYIRVNGHPLMLFNVLDRKFFLFGIFFGPQDFHLLVLAMISGIVFIALFTAIFGRLFCGWACPQTVFMEMIFRKIEYWIEGDYTRIKALDRQEWNEEKIKKRTLKHFLFLLISFIISNTFLAYLIGSDEVFRYISDGPLHHAGTFFSLILFTGVFYGVFSWMREQVCTVICPYGRLQGVLLDPQSMVVAYDFVRGEPRGNPKKEKEKKLGDCIDCGQCVNVCPTGIDIRNGTQLECVGCTACIDACDDIMYRVSKPRGLVRYASIDNIKNGKNFSFTLRMGAYSAVLVILLCVLGYLLATRTPLEATILRSPGTTFQTQTDGRISNIYNIKLANKTSETMSVDIRLLSHEGEIRMIGHMPILGGGDVAQATLLLLMNRQDLKGMTTPVSIGIYHRDELLETCESTFFGPKN